MTGTNNLPTQYPLYTSSLKQNKTGIYGERLCLDKDYTAPVHLPVFIKHWSCN